MVIVPLLSQTDNTALIQIHIQKGREVGSVSHAPVMSSSTLLTIAIIFEIFHNKAFLLRELVTPNSSKLQENKQENIHDN